jgi:tetratricopeptide (TPR) repeat protein
VKQVVSTLSALIGAREDGLGAVAFVRCANKSFVDKARQQFIHAVMGDSVWHWHELNAADVSSLSEVFAKARTLSTASTDTILAYNFPPADGAGSRDGFYDDVSAELRHINAETGARMVCLITVSALQAFVRGQKELWSARAAFVAWPSPPPKLGGPADSNAQQTMAEEGKTPAQLAEALKERIRGLSAGVEKAELTMRYALFRASEGQLEEARMAAIHSAKQFKDSSELRQMALAYELLGSLAERRGDVDEARDWLRTAISTWQDKGNEEHTAECFAKLGHLSYLCGDHEQASRQFQKALEIDDALGNKAKVSAGLRRLGLLAEGQSDYEMAAKMYREAAEVVDEIGDRPGLSRCYHHLGRLHERSGDLEEALRWHTRSRKLKEELEDRLGLATSYHHLGNVYFLMKNLDDADSYYQRALKLELEFNDLFGRASTLKQLGEVSMARSDRQDAMRCFLFAYSLWKELGSPLQHSVVAHIARLRELIDEETVKALENETRGLAQEAAKSGDKSVSVQQ